MRILTRFPTTGNSIESFRFSELPFLTDMDKWQYTDVFEDAQIIPEISDSLNSVDRLKSLVIDRMKPNQILLILGVWHSDNTVFCELQLRQIYKQLEDLGCKQCIFVHTNEQLSNKDFASVDLMWNRQKLYFTEYRNYRDLDKRVWTMGCTELVYTFDQIKFDNIRPKIALSPSRIYGPPQWPKHIRMDQRKKLRETLSNYPGMIDINDYTNNEFFLPNQITDLLLEKIKGPGTWYPIADRHYSESYVSIYVETITLNKGNQCATEKSFDPLIKGHFILPMGNYYYVKLLKEKYGFKFPSWINYDYDSEPRDSKRFELYLNSVKQLLSIDKETIHNYAKKDIEILEHNRSIFYTRPYHSLYQSINDCINHRNLLI